MPKRGCDDVIEPSPKRRKLNDDDIIKIYHLDNIETIDDLLNLISLYDKGGDEGWTTCISSRTRSKFTNHINYDRIFHILNALFDLRRIVGMTKLKRGIVSMIRFYLSGMIRDTDMKNMPRELDVDILVYGNVEININMLKLPHPKIRERKFVLKPWNDIAPNYYLKQYSNSISNLLNITEDKSDINMVLIIDEENK